MSDPLPAFGHQRRPGLAVEASPSAPVRSRRVARLPVGSLVYLAFIGLVAVVTIGVFFGIGFLLLAQPKEGPAARSDSRDYAAGINPSAAGERSTRRDIDMAQRFVPIPPDREALANTATGASPSDKGPAPGSTASEAASVAPAQPGEARATIDLNRSAVHDGARDPEPRAASHHKHRAHSRHQKTEHAAHRFPYGAQFLTPPQPGGYDPFR
jgi:cell division septation protein DedD